MAQRFVVYWRDIPTQVIVKQGRVTQKRELPERFVAAVDRAAMRSGATGTDEYLAEWRRGEPIACGDDLAAEADAAAAEIIAGYDQARLDGLAKAGGREQS
jgi:hypothetical protein